MISHRYPAYKHHGCLYVTLGFAVVTDILRSDDSSDNAKLKSAEILGKYYSLFDGAFGDEPRRSSDELLQELEQLLEGG